MTRPATLNSSATSSSNSTDFSSSSSSPEEENEKLQWEGLAEKGGFKPGVKELVVATVRGTAAQQSNTRGTRRSCRCSELNDGRSSDSPGRKETRTHRAAPRVTTPRVLLPTPATVRTVRRSDRQLSTKETPENAQMQQPVRELRMNALELSYLLYSSDHSTLQVDLQERFA